jgi:hypothetical protein
MRNMGQKTMPDAQNVEKRIKSVDRQGRLSGDLPFPQYPYPAWVSA